MPSNSRRMTKALSSKQQPGKMLGPGCLVAFFGIFAFVGLIFFYGMFLIPMWNMTSSRNWESVPCKIVTSEVETHEDSDGDTYSIRIVYTYTYQGRELQSDRYDFVTGSSSGRQGKQAIVDRYPPGLETTCWVNPNKPEQAVLNRDFRPSMLFGLIPLVFVAVGIVPLIVFLRRDRSEKKSPSGQTAMSEPLDEDDEEWDEDEDDELEEGPTGPQQLKSTSPLAKFIGMLVVCLFWNGVVSIFVAMAVNSIVQGKPQWFLTLFLTPFVVVGLLLLLGVVHSFLSLFNPRPTVVIEDANLAIGSRTQVRWTFRGNTYSMRRLKLTLVGTEKATYRRGTSTYTDTEKFAEIVVYETSRATEMVAGTAVVEIPERTMHSFKCSNNEIEWKLHLHGSIAFWPDVSEEFPIVVRPMAG